MAARETAGGTADWAFLRRAHIQLRSRRATLVSVGARHLGQGSWCRGVAAGVVGRSTVFAVLSRGVFVYVKWVIVACE